MVDGDTGRDGGFYLVGTVGQILHVIIGGHGGQGDHRVQHIVDAAHQKGGLSGKQMVSKAIEEADHHQNQGVCHHDGLVAHLVDEAARQRCGKEADHSGNGKQQADSGGIGPVKQDQHIRTEGEEHLLSRSVEHFQHIVFGVFLMEIEPAFGLIGSAASGDLQGADRSHTHQHRRNAEKQLVGRIGLELGEDQHDYQIACQRTDLTGGALHTLGCAAASGTGVLQGKRAFHTQLDVFAQRVNADGQRGQDLSGGKHCVHAHAKEHDHRTGFVKGLRGQHEKHRQDQHQSDSGQLPEKLRDAPVQLSHGYHFRKEIIQHSFIKAVGQTGNENRQQKELVSGAIFVNRAQGVSQFHGKPPKQGKR